MIELVPEQLLLQKLDVALSLPMAGRRTHFKHKVTTFMRERCHWRKSENAKEEISTDIQFVNRYIHSYAYIHNVVVKSRMDMV